MQRRGYVAPLPEKVRKPRKPKRAAWTKESALGFITKAKKNGSKGLSYWSAIDYLRKVHDLNHED